MSNSILLVGLVCVVAGAAIKVWAFAVFTAFLIIAMSIASMLGGASVGETAILAVTLIAVMEICYLAGVIASHLGRPVLRQWLPKREKPKPAPSIQKTMQVRRDQSQG